jgi:predicted dehydrogenase
MDHQHKIVFLTSLNDVPEKIDIAIIATGASIRERVTAELLSVCSVQCLILEKVLFQQASSYERILDLIRSTGTRAWVNHPRRMFPHYRSLKKALRSTPAAPLVFQVTGTSWGLGCNALHLLDLISFLTDSPLLQVETNWIDPVIHDSKREGHIEFTGTLKATFGDDSHGTISSLPGTPGPVTVTIATATDKWIIQEGGTPGVIRMDSLQQYTHTFEAITTLSSQAMKKPWRTTSFFWRAC